MRTIKEVQETRKKLSDNELDWGGVYVSDAELEAWEKEWHNMVIKLEKANNLIKEARACPQDEELSYDWFDRANAFLKENQKEEE